MTSLPCITLNRYGQERARKRHPWVFSNELSDPKQFQRLEPGSLVDVLDSHGEFLGTGFINPKSLISVRFVSRQRGEEIGVDFFRRRIAAALQVREPFYGANSLAKGTYRAVFGESDGLPGLVIDRFLGAWVVEPHALGMYQRAELIAEAMESFLGSDALVFRTDTRSAQLEGMEPGARLLRGKIPESGAFAVEDGISFPVDPLHGQKTGFFFDQRDNRSFFRSWVSGAAAHGRKIEVLDLFCHAGAWGLRALKAGAKSATFVDSSASALASVKAAAEKMGVLDRVECLEGDALTVLRSLRGRTFGGVVLDPPALIPSKKSISAGSHAYRELNSAALQLVAAEGAFSTSSCSYHLQEDRLEEIVAKSLVESGRSARVLQRGGLSADHPFLPGMEEGRYLKNFFLSVN